MNESSLNPVDFGHSKIMNDLLQHSDGSVGAGSDYRGRSPISQGEEVMPEGTQIGAGYSLQNDLAMCEFEDSQFQANDMGLYDMGDDHEAGNRFYSTLEKG